MTKKLRKHLWAVALLAALLVLVTVPASTAAQEDNETAQQNNDYTIGYAVSGFDHPLFQSMMEGATNAGEELGVELLTADAQFDVNRQISQIENFIAQDVDALMVNPAQAKEVVPVLNDARDAGIPVIAIDTRPVGFDPEAYVSMDHYQGGYIIGRRVAEDMQCEGRWATIWAAGNEQAASRIRGFEAGLAEYCRITGLENNFVKEGQYSGLGDSLREEARGVTNTLLTKYPEGELAFVLGQTDEFANGAYLATQASNRSDVSVYGMDDNTDIQQFIAEEKNLVATTMHMPAKVGQAAVQTTVQILNDEPHLKNTLLNFRVVDQNSVELDPGYGGNHQPSFSSYFFPQELEVIFGNSSNVAAAQQQASDTEESSGGGLTTLTTVLLVAVVVLALAIVATVFWARQRIRGGGS